MVAFEREDRACTFPALISSFGAASFVGHILAAASSSSAAIAHQCPHLSPPYYHASVTCTIALYFVLHHFRPAPTTIPIGRWPSSMRSLQFLVFYELARPRILSPRRLEPATPQTGDHHPAGRLVAIARSFAKLPGSHPQPPLQHRRPSSSAETFFLRTPHSEPLRRHPVALRYRRPALEDPRRPHRPGPRRLFAGLRHHRRAADNWWHALTGTQISALARPPASSSISCACLLIVTLWHRSDTLHPAPEVMRTYDLFPAQTD